MPYINQNAANGAFVRRDGTQTDSPVDAEVFPTKWQAIAKRTQETDRTREYHPGTFGLIPGENY